MSPDQLRERLRALGFRSVAAQARALGVSTRQIDRYRAGERIPRHVLRTLDLYGQVAKLRAELAAAQRSRPSDSSEAP